MRCIYIYVQKLKNYLKKKKTLYRWPLDEMFPHLQRDGCFQLFPTFVTHEELSTDPMDGLNMDVQHAFLLERFPTHFTDPRS